MHRTGSSRPPPVEAQFRAEATRPVGSAQQAARPPPQVAPQFRLEETRPTGADRPREFRRRTQTHGGDKYGTVPADLYDPGVTFIGLYPDPSSSSTELNAVFRIDDPRHPGGHYFRYRTQALLRDKQDEPTTFIDQDEEGIPYFRTNLSEIRRAKAAFEELEGAPHANDGGARVFEFPSTDVG